MNRTFSLPIVNGVLKEQFLDIRMIPVWEGIQKQPNLTGYRDSQQPLQDGLVHFDQSNTGSLWSTKANSLPKGPKVSLEVVFMTQWAVCDMPGFPVLHQLPEFAQTHVCWVDALQPSHPWSPSSPPAFNLPQHQGVFQWVSSSHHVAKVLKLQL